MVPSATSFGIVIASSFVDFCMEVFEPAKVEEDNEKKLSKNYEVLLQYKEAIDRGVINICISIL
jgi:hypothetical protein